MFNVIQKFQNRVEQTHRKRLVAAAGRYVKVPDGGEVEGLSPEDAATVGVLVAINRATARLEPRRAAGAEFMARVAKLEAEVEAARLRSIAASGPGSRPPGTRVCDWRLQAAQLEVALADLEERVAAERAQAAAVALVERQLARLKGAMSSFIEHGEVPEVEPLKDVLDASDLR